MAQYKMDIVDVNLNTGNIHRSFLSHTIGQKDEDADRFGVRAFRDGVPVDLSGCSCHAWFLNSQGTTLALTDYGTVDGNEAYVTLPQACYDYDGQFCLAIKLVGGGISSTVRIIDGVVDNIDVGGSVSPTSEIPDYSAILSQYAAMVAATSAANTAIAETFDATKAYPAGKYVINTGALYRLPAGHEANVTWANTSKVAAKIGDDVSELKSAIDDIDYEIYSQMKGSDLWRQGSANSASSTSAVTTLGTVFTNNRFCGVSVPDGWYANLAAWTPHYGDTFIGYYKDDGTFVNARNNSTEMKGVRFFKDVIDLYPSYEFLVTASKINGTTISPSDATNIVLFNSKIDGLKTEIAETEERIDNMQKNNPIQFTFNGSLLSEDEKYSFSYTRDSVAYDDNYTQIAKNNPVYNSLKYFREKGIAISPATTNLLDSAKSQTLSSAETLSLDSGDYAVSVGGGKVTISGDATGTAVPYKYATFTLASSGSVTLTPTDGNATYVQIEKLGYATPWQIGGTQRKIGELKLNNISDISFNEFGIGLMFRPYCNSDVYKNNEMYLVNGYKDTNNFFNIRYKPSTNHVVSYFKIAGNVYEVDSPWESNKKLTFTNRDIIGVYVHVVPTRGIYSYVMRDGIVSLSVGYQNIPALPQLVSFVIGSRTINDGGRDAADCVFSNLRLDIGRKPDAMEYFKEVLER